MLAADKELKDYTIRANEDGLMVSISESEENHKRQLKQVV